MKLQNRNLVGETANEKDDHIFQCHDKIEALEAENARLKTLLTRMYNKGYKAGHHATVEGQYVDILDEDMDTYHDDIVNEILSE